MRRPALALSLRTSPFQVNPYELTNSMLVTVQLRVLVTREQQRVANKCARQRARH